MQILNILARRYLPLERLDETVMFYETLIGQKARLRFDYPQYDLRLAPVASILFIAGTDESLTRFLPTHLTFLVEDIDAFASHLPTVGASILEAPKAVPTGRNMLVRHPDDTLVEYVEHHDKHPQDVLPAASEGNPQQGQRA
ncbi:VOC family protein [Bradyrhizobium uaiense]|uniref:VOC family protein n=1 Tax=Bradyrhizobium uaiense TaxID=2594946 RepID=A0A6P1BQJ3_9BRAD|nr:VOC family protein [Bradyrhizobium uaiense]NEV00515.1 VOC family protein [Bradyrhizobium uaiense]